MKYSVAGSVNEQLASLTPNEREGFNELREYWDSKKDEVVYDDYMILRLCRAFPAKDRFNIKIAKKVADRLADWERSTGVLSITIEEVRPHLKNGCLVITGGYNKEGYQTLYMKPSLFFPGKDNLDDLIRSLCYLLQCMTLNERVSKAGISFIANLDDWVGKIFPKGCSSI